MESEYYQNEDGGYDQGYGGQSDDIGLQSRDSSQQEELRDHEYLEHAGSKDGFQYISGMDANNYDMYIYFFFIKSYL